MAQLEAKQKELAGNLERIGHVAPVEWLPPLLGPHWNYRRRARLSSRYVAKKGRSLVGFREKQGKYVADVSRCEVLAEPVERSSHAGRAADGDGAPREHSADRGRRCPTARGPSCARARIPLGEDDLEMLRDFERAQGLRILLQPGGLHTIAPLHAGSRRPCLTAWMPSA
jgi:23S rRNA (uracil1939-C5)-methyltransferase